MNDLIESKNKITTELNDIIMACNNLLNGHNDAMDILRQELKKVNEFNSRLSEEISEKDKLLYHNEKKMNDYEIMINQIQDDANKEMSSKERYTIMKAQDNEINDKNIEITRLNKKIELLIKKDPIINVETWKDPIINVETWKEEIQNSFWEDSEKVKIAIETYSKHIGKEVTLEDVGKTSMGINGWYEDGMQQLNKKTLDKKVQEIINDVDDTENINVDTESLTDDNNNNDEETESLTDDDEPPIEVSLFTYRRKEYYTRDDETGPKYIYNLIDGELSEAIGEIKGNKKVFYKSSKK
tara:strand:+ start:1422 stop:2315 length:894 start_codon:yes stop_codon:yes gene_type:complete